MWWKKLAAFSGAGLLSLAGCGADTQTTLVQTVAFPGTADETNSDDIDGDGDVQANDNSFAGLAQNQLLVDAGLDLNGLLQGAVDAGTVAIGFNITAKNFADDDKKAAAEAFLADLGGAAPAFDGTDDLSTIADGGGPFAFNGVTIVGGQITSDNTNEFVLSLPFDPAAPTNISLKQAKFAATIAADGAMSAGKLTGRIDAADFAAGFEGVSTLINNLTVDDAVLFNPAGTPVTCGDQATCDGIAGGGVCTDDNGDANATGLCVGAASTSAANFDDNGGGIGGLGIAVDTDNNGVFDVSFNGTSFDVNELAALFDFDAADGDGDGSAVEGLLGVVIFQLDLDAGVPGTDAAGVGVEFTSAAATSSSDTVD